MNKHLNLSVILFLLSFGFINPGYSNMSEHELAIGNRIHKMHNDFGQKALNYTSDICSKIYSNIDKCQVGSKMYIDREEINLIEELWSIYNTDILNVFKNESLEYEKSNDNIRLALDILNYVTTGDKSNRDYFALSDKECLFSSKYLLTSFEVINLNNVIPSTVKFDYMDDLFEMQSDTYVTITVKFVNINFMNNYLSELNFDFRWESSKTKKLYLSSSANMERAQKAINLLFSEACQGTEASEF